MKDFKSVIGGSAEDIKNIRVQNCVNSVCDESKMAIMNMRKDYRNLQVELENLLDLGITNTMDVATNVKNVNAPELVKNLHELADNMLICARQLKLRIKIHNTLFPDNKEESLKDTELDFLKGLI